MHLLLTIIAFFFIFSLLILVHEFGHFYMAKRNGVKIEEFGFGLPPKIWGKKVGETVYSINWIPFGGFVRMLGEDARDKKAAKNPRSFMHKSIWQRTQVVCAGVVMNFFLAWILLSIGFMAGMQPLMINGSEFLDEIEAGRITLAHGVQVDVVTEGSWAEEKGFQAGDVITSFNGEPIQDLTVFYEATQGGQPFEINGQSFTPDDIYPVAGFQFNVFELPRVIVEAVDEGVPLQAGDVLVTLNGETVFYSSDVQATMTNVSTGTLNLEIVRNGEVMPVEWTLPEEHRVVISKVLAGSPAETVGLEAGDRVMRVNDQEIFTPEQAVEVVTLSEDPTVLYEIERGDVRYVFEIEKNENGLVGVMLTNVFSKDNVGFSYYDGSEIVSVTEIQDVQVPWYQSFGKALGEIKRISGYTVVMIAHLFGQIFTTGEVPEGVAGPVGIAQMTGLYVEEGLVALMRFTALLSLSLAVINIFPFPALDGGRMLFIVIELFRGKPLDTRVEGIIHSIGFFFLLAVIFLVTFKDLQRLF